jgi:branched-chain amino acid transport system permease protein
MKKYQFTCGLAIVLLSFVGLAAPAWSQPEQEINGTLQIRKADGDRAPAEGVIITVEGVGEAISNADGTWSISIPEPGVYLVFVDEESLPDGVSLRTVGRSSLEVEVEAGKSKTALFSLVEGEGTAAGTDTSEGITGRRVAQLTVEGLKQGLYLAMAAVGLSLIYGTTGLVNFAHAELVTWGGLSTYFFNYYGLAGMIGFLAPLPAPLGAGSNLVFAALFGMIAGGAVGYFLDRFLFRRLRKQGVSLIAQMVITIGLSILMRYMFVYFFGGSPRSFRNFTAQSAVDIGPIQITPKDLIAMGISVVVLLAIGGILTFTRIGKAMRAVSDNRDLAESSGIDVQRVISTVWIFGGSVAALGGVFFGLDQVKWDFGFRILLLIFAAVTLGGLGTAYGALVGAIVIGLVVNLSTLFIDPELKNMIALLSMVLVLMFRPQGLLGRAERIG